MFRKLSYLALALLPAVALVAWLFSSQPHDATFSPDAVSPVPIDQLGLAVDHEARAAVVAQALPRFQIVGAGADEDNSKKNVRLWDAVVRIRGEHLPNVPQQIGDCVSFGSANAQNYLLYQQIDEGQAQEFHAAFPPFNYGASRITIGKQHGSHFSGDGSVGAYAAEAAQQCGILPADHPQCPKYSGDIAKAWGRTGPPQWALDVAKANRIQTVAQMRSAADVRDANCHRYTVIICSNFGTRTIRQQDGRMVARHDASWGHCMCVLAYDGTGHTPYFYILNSWGPDAHPKPLQGEPPGGFWVDWKTMEWICQSGDCWAFSLYEGFPTQQDLDLSPLRRRTAAKPALRQVERSFGGSNS